MLITLTPKRQFEVPIEAKCITPDIFAKSVDEIAKQPIWEGNKKRLLSELFKIESEKKEPSDEVTIRIFGSVSKVRRIGSKMCQGKIIIDGDVGMHLGEEMKGGTIIVSGNAGSWTGSMMKNVHEPTLPETMIVPPFISSPRCIPALPSIIILPWHILAPILLTLLMSL